MPTKTSAANSAFDRQILADVHRFWFGETEPSNNCGEDGNPDLWFDATPDQDDRIRDRFGSCLDQASAANWGDLAALSPREQIGLVVLLDQLPRNMFRQSGRQFAFDAIAIEIARRLVADDDRRFGSAERKFLYLPFCHREDQADQDLSVFLFAKLAREVAPSELENARVALDYATKHRDIIRKFGRFPHRNGLLARESTPEEIAFLKGGRGF